MTIRTLNKALLDDIVTTLKERLPSELTLACSENDIDATVYRIKTPEVYVRAASQVAEVFRILNVDEIACWVHRDDVSSLDTRFTSDQTQYNEVRLQPVRISIIQKEPSGWDYPEFNGRVLLPQEFMTMQAEIYMAGITTSITRYLESKDSCHQVFLESTYSESTQIPEFGEVAMASVTFQILQDVLIPNRP